MGVTIFDVILKLILMVLLVGFLLMMGLTCTVVIIVALKERKENKQKGISKGAEQ